MIFELTAQVTGNVTFYIDADTKEEALELFEDKYDSADFGALSDIEHEEPEIID